MNKSNSQQVEEQQLLNRNMEKIKHKIIVMSGKGGVGKSTVAVNLAVALANAGNQVGLLDVDIHGPSVPRMLGLDGSKVNQAAANQLAPVNFSENLKVISMGFLMDGDDAPVIWRGPLKYSAIKQFLTDVAWGELDYLIIDSPPGTGDEPLSVCQMLPEPDGAIIVTTPQDVALIDVKKSISFCKKLNMPIIGLVENMSGFICPSCRIRVDIFKNGGGKKLAADSGLNFLGDIPIDPAIVAGSDNGDPFTSEDTDSKVFNSFEKIITQIEKNVSQKK